MVREMSELWLHEYMALRRRKTTLRVGFFNAETGMLAEREEHRG